MKFTVEFNPEAAAVIDRLASKKGASKAEVVRQALNLRGRAQATPRRRNSPKRS